MTIHKMINLTEIHFYVIITPIERGKINEKHILWHNEKLCNKRITNN